MNENNYGNDYEPNFIMKENPEQPQATQSRPTVQPQTAQSQGLYRDPRSNFQGDSARTAAGQGGSASWTGGVHRAQANTEPAFSGGTESGYKSGRARKEKKPSKPVSLTKKSLALLIALCVGLSGVFGFTGAMIGNSVSGGDEAVTTQYIAGEDIETTGYDLQNATGSNMTIQQITNKALNSVVEIRTEGAATDSWMRQYVTEGAGSGVIISKDGYIITNNHVVSGASKITVTTTDKKSYNATVVGTDSTNDVAVIKIKASGLTPATYGNSDQLKVGDLAVAIGNPLGELGGTVTAGIISAKDRELTIDGKSMKLLQTDSSINPGNSGGGLFNGDGQLVGIVVAKSSGSDVEGLGFAIPINTAASVAKQLMDQGYVSGQPWTGMTYSEGSSGFESFFGGSSGGTVYIYSVDTTKAKLAGFKPGDVVFAVEGRQITSIDDLSSIITSHKVGDKLKFTIVRDGKTQDLTLELQEKTKEQMQQ